MIDSELPEVRVGTCGCVLPNDTLPIGFRFVATATGDKRVLVFCCREHNRTTAPPVVKKATRVQLVGKKLTPGG